MRDDVQTETASAYRAPAWLPGGHAQTIWPYLLRRTPHRLRRERVETADGDFWDFDWRGVVPHFRGCGGELNRLPRAYHSGDHEEVGSMLAAIRERVNVQTTSYAVGVSLGGSTLLNWLGRAERSAAEFLSAAAAISAPL